MAAPGCVVVATANPGKLVEFRRLLRGIEVTSLADLPGQDVRLPEETGTTFAENAALKALAVSRLTTLPVVADDSGICVDHLGGRPGILSARHGGPGLSDAQRTALLLAEMAGVAEPLRGAHYRAVVALARSGRLLSLHEGACGGILMEEPRGAGGFGYDPAFLVPAFGLTMAELTPEQKDSVSHRARAVAGLLAALADGVLEA